MSTSGKRGLSTYLVTVATVAVPLVLLVGTQAVRTGLTSQALLIAVLFGLIMILGEMRPIPVARGLEAGDEITVSTTFGFGLLLIAPVFTAVAAQAVALTIDCLVRRSPLVRLPFNISQYALALITARFTYSALSGDTFTPHGAIQALALSAALAAGIAFLLVNNVLVGIAVSLSVGLRLTRVLVGDLKWQITTSAPLIGLGPLAAQAMSWTPLAIVLLLMPVAALHHTGTMAMRREQEALRDSLTGLANRTMLTTAASRALAESQGRTAMLLLDLDHFKDINDTLGHAVGDQMLMAVSSRLRDEAGPDNLIARLGGDEFVVLARDVPDADAAVALAERLGAAVREAVVLQGVTLTVGCSIGIAFGPDQAESVSDLLRCADVALYDAKAARGTVAVYDKHTDAHSAAQLGLHADLRQALEDVDDTQLWVAFQPQLDLSGGAVESVECLARWQHPELGNVSPDVFIPIAESTSLIDLLLHRVLDTALRGVAEWDTAGLHLLVSVNLSARHLSDISLPATVRAYLERYGVDPRRLVLEVTESRLLSNPELSVQIVRDLHDLGVQISIDDFGTGYSSLAHLQRLAVNELKIDKSFMGELDEPNNAAIVRSTIELGHNLNLRVVAEGVETPHVARQLERMGCDVLQGYLIGRPVPAAEIPQLVSVWNELADDETVAAGSDGDDDADIDDDIDDDIDAAQGTDAEIIELAPVAGRGTAVDLFEKAQ